MSTHLAAENGTAREQNRKGLLLECVRQPKGPHCRLCELTCVRSEMSFRASFAATRHLPNQDLQDNIQDRYMRYSQVLFSMAREGLSPLEDAELRGAAESVTTST